MAFQTKEAVLARLNQTAELGEAILAAVRESGLLRVKHRRKKAKKRKAVAAKAKAVVTKPTAAQRRQRTEAVAKIKPGLGDMPAQTEAPKESHYIGRSKPKVAPINEVDEDGREVTA